jgi:hypothetical protein
MKFKKPTYKLPRFEFKLPTNIGIKIPSFSGMKLPTDVRFRLPIPTGVYLGGGKLIMISLGTVALGFAVSTFMLVNTGEQQITFPALGASYDNGSTVGRAITDIEQPEARSQTLQINAAGGTRLGTITLKNISLGKTGLADAFQIAGVSATEAIAIGTIEIKNSSFPSFDIGSSEIYKLDAGTGVECAGHTFDATMSNATDNLTITSTRGATDYTAENMTVDRIIIKTSEAADDGSENGHVLISKLILDNVNAWIGTANIDFLHAGTFTISNSQFGDDGDIDSSDCVVNQTVNVNTVIDGIVEKPIFIR